MGIGRRHLLTGAAVAGLPLTSLPLTGRAQSRPRITFVSQWSSGSDATAIADLGRHFEQDGGIWQHLPVPGFTTEMMNKLRADIAAGNPPSASQIKGPEIAAFAKIAPVVDLDPLVPAGYDKLMSAELAHLHQPYGDWIALPIQVYRTNDLFLSRVAMNKVGATKAPATWAEFNELATRMRAAGITPLANGGLRWDDGMKLEIALAGISATAYRAALMELKPEALRGPEMLQAFAQLRKLTGWLDPDTAQLHYSTNLRSLIKGETGMLLMGGFAQGLIHSLGADPGDVLVTSAPQDQGKPCFILNVDSMIFWQRDEPDLIAGQRLLVRLMTQKDVQERFCQTTGSIPPRTDIDLSGPDWTDGQRAAMAARVEAIKADRVLLSFAHNMALPNPTTQAMIDVVVQFVRNAAMTPEQAAARMALAAANAQR